jgi:aspartyl protease family protein
MLSLPLAQERLAPMSRIVTFALVALIMAVVVARFADRSARTVVAPAAMAVTPPPPEPANPLNSRAVTLSPGNGGHFWTDARVDGLRLQFVVDTGASAIALRESDAARLGIHPAARDFNIKVGTANGVSQAALVQLRMVEIGNIVVRDVPALVHRDDALGVNLLGMSFLSRVRWTHDRGRLVLEQ